MIPANDHIKAKAWAKDQPPRRILTIRLQAMGDMVITLPYLQQLRNDLPSNTIIDFLTREEVDDIPKNLQLFDHVYSIGGGRNEKKQLIYTAWLLPKLLLNRYDAVIDLQNNKVSNFVRHLLHPMAWSSFDRTSSNAAGERTRRTIEAAGFAIYKTSPKFIFKNKFDAAILLKMNGWDGVSKLVVLNPAGAFETRNWPQDHYVRFAELWLEQFPSTQFLILGTEFINKKAAYLKRKLNGHLINLIDKTSPSDAISILQKTSFVLSEDSGLMHMAWVSGIPTIALFGSTRSDWARPLGSHTFFFDSSDMECGNCMKQLCRYNDNRCLTRISPEDVFEKAISLITSIKPAHAQTL